MIEFKGSHFEREVILWGVRWYVAYPISYRQLEEMMQERGVEVDHSTLNRWVVKYVPLLDEQFRARKRPVGSSWRMDETYVRIKGVWKYLYRAVDKAGATVDFLLTAKRDRKAARDHARSWGEITRLLIELDYRCRTGSSDNDGGRHPRASRSAPPYERRGRTARSSGSSASVVSCSYVWPRFR